MADVLPDGQTVDEAALAGCVLASFCTCIRGMHQELAPDHWQTPGRAMQVMEEVSGGEGEISYSRFRSEPR